VLIVCVLIGDLKLVVPMGFGIFVFWSWRRASPQHELNWDPLLVNQDISPLATSPV